MRDAALWAEVEEGSCPRHCTCCPMCRATVLVDSVRSPGEDQVEEVVLLVVLLAGRAAVHCWLQLAHWDIVEAEGVSTSCC